MLFFRVETPSTHDGPYVSHPVAPSIYEYIAKRTGQYDHDPSRQPAPHSDDGNMKAFYRDPHSYRVVFGFTSLDQLFSWFYRDEELDFLKSGFYVCAIYEVSSIPYSSSHQAAAYRDDLRFIEALPF